MVGAGVSLFWQGRREPKGPEAYESHVRKLCQGTVNTDWQEGTVELGKAGASEGLDDGKELGAAFLHYCSLNGTTDGRMCTEH